MPLDMTTKPSELQEALAELAPYFWCAFGFAMLSGLLMFAPTLYMFDVYGGDARHRARPGSHSGSTIRLACGVGGEVRRSVFAEGLQAQRALELVAEFVGALAPLHGHADREEALRAEVAALPEGEVAQVFLKAQARDVDPGFETGVGSGVFINGHCGFVECYVGSFNKNY